MKIQVGFWFVFALPGVISAQAQFVSSNQKVSEMPQEKRILSLSERKVLPLFGEISKSSDQIKEEVSFLNDCDANFGSRKEASQFFAARGWEYLQEGRLDTASYRFNLAYLLNEKNVDAYWGLGVVCFQQEDFNNAYRMLKKGVEVDPQNVPLMVDLSSISIKLYEDTADSLKLNDVHRLLTQAASLDSNYAQTFFNLAIAEYYQGHFNEAWENIHKGRALNFSLVNLQFIEQLSEKAPDPKGFFKNTAN
jgi:tetratricopeptide (TPR) repeat protein